MSSSPSQQAPKISADKRSATIPLLILAALVVVSIVFTLPPSRMTDPVVKLLTSMVWPFVVLFGIALFRPQIESLMSVVIERVAHGAGLKIAWVGELISETISKSANKIPIPPSGERVTLINVALLHTSFLPKRQPSFNAGLVYLQIEIVVIAPDDVMDRIASVTYRFDDSYPPQSREQVRVDRRDRFKVKELANGTSIVRAEIKLFDQENPIYLNRFIDLRRDGPRI